MITFITNPHSGCWHRHCSCDGRGVGGRRAFPADWEGGGFERQPRLHPPCPGRGPPTRTLLRRLACRGSSSAATRRPAARGDMAGGHRLLLENAQQVVMVCARGERFLARDALHSLAVLEGASLVVGT